MHFDSPFSTRLDTNYVPTVPELDTIEHLIDARQAVVDGIDTKIEELDRLRKELEAEKSAHTQYIVKHRSLTAIVRRLPTDIMSAIFLTWLSLSRCDGSAHPSVTISHVCRQWRDLALGMPLLWTRIHLSIPTIPTYYEKWADQWSNYLLAVDNRTAWFVAHAGECPLELSLTAFDPADAICEEVLANGETFLDSMFDALTRCYMKDWRSLRLHLRVNPSNSISILFLRLGMASDRNVPTIDIDVASSSGKALNGDDWQKLDGQIDLIGSSCTDLTARLAPADLRRVRIPWSSLSNLTIGPPTTKATFLARDALDILAVAPTLLRCTAEFSFGLASPSAPYRTRVGLPQLRSLTIRGDCPPKEFPSALDLPSITHFSFIPNRSPNPQGEIDSAVVQMIRQYGTQLVDVTFDYQALTRPALEYALSHLPDVESLQLTTFDRVHPTHNFPLNGAPERWFPATLEPLLHKFTPTSNDSHSAKQGQCFCPKLKTLVCSLFEVTEEVRKNILSLVQSRRRGEATASPVQWLDYLSLHFEEGSINGLRSELEGLGVSVKRIELAVRAQ